jgi:hypothetical protein
VKPEEYDSAPVFEYRALDLLAPMDEIGLRLHAIPAEQVWESRTLSLSMVVRYAAFKQRIEAYQDWLSAMFREGMRRAESGELATWRIDEMSPNLRLRRYLARALVWPNNETAQELAELDGLDLFPAP